MNDYAMKLEDEARLILEAVAKSATSGPARDLARGVRSRLSKGVKTLGLRVFDEVTQRMTGAEPEPEDYPIRKPKVVSAQDAAKMYAKRNTEDPPIAKVDTQTTMKDQPKVETTKPSTSKRYGINRVVLLVRHPDRGFAYWEIASERISENAVGQLELQNADDDSVIHQVEVDPQQGRHYFDLPDPEGRYCAELFLKDGSGDWTSLSTSYPAKFDPDNPTGSQPPTRTTNP